MTPETLTEAPPPEPPTLADPEAGAGFEAPPRRPRRGAIRRSLDILGKRRRFLIDRRSQLRACLMTVTLAFVLLVLLNMSLHTARQSGLIAAAAISPELEQVIRGQNRLETALLVVASGVFLLSVFAVTLLETHKTAGAEFQMARCLAEIRNGHYKARPRLRKSDNLRALEKAFNEMSLALRERTEREVEALGALADACENLNGLDDARLLAGSIRAHAAEKRARLDT